MSDLIEEIKQKQRQRAWSTAITTVIVIVGMAALIVYTIKYDKDRQKTLNTYGGAVGVQNQTDHRVTLHLFLHDKPGAPVLSRTIEPQGHWVICDSMSKKKVADFPPINWLDSALFIFDDTLLWRQTMETQWYVAWRNHYIQESTCWKYESLTVRRRSRHHPALYRPLRVYYITDEDYERARVKQP